MLNKRQILRMTTTLPVIGGMTEKGLIYKTLDKRSEKPIFKRNYFWKLGLCPFINGRETIMTLSGSLKHPEVMEVMN